MRHYELVLLVHPDQSEQVPEMINRYEETVKKSNGIIHRTEDIGRRALAYTIEDMHKAHYVLMNIESDESVISELESLFKFNDSIMRHLIVKSNKAETGISKLLELHNKKDDSKKKRVNSRKINEKTTEEKDKTNDDSSNVDKEDKESNVDKEDKEKVESQEGEKNDPQEKDIADEENTTEQKVEEEDHEKKEG
jgi:small subunit ribosomal protein S6